MSPILLRRIPLKHIFAVSFMFLIMLLFIGVYLMEWLWEENHAWRREYYIFTRGCRMKKLSQTDTKADNDIRNSIDCAAALTSISADGSSIIRNLNSRQIKELYEFKGDWLAAKCVATYFGRWRDDKNIYNEQSVWPLKHTVEPIGSPLDFIQVECFDGEKKSFYKDYHFRVQPQPKKSFIGDDSTKDNRISVLLFAMNNISKTNVDKQLPKTMSFLRAQNNFLEFRGYQSIAEDAFSNILPLLVDQKLLQNITNLNATNYVQHLDCSVFVWDWYRTVGYSTVFAENSAKSSLFNEKKFKFVQQPTDYYLRPFLLEISKAQTFNARINKECKGSHYQPHLVFEMMQKLIPHYKQQDFFSFYWFSKQSPITQQDDNVFYKTLFAMKVAGIFDRTFIFFVSNVPSGAKDELPLLFTLYPSKVLSKYPLALKNFKTNSVRLSTPMDLHVTLLNLLDLDMLQNDELQSRQRSKEMPAAVSLFLEHSEWRTCRDAKIPDHLCECVLENESM